MKRLNPTGMRTLFVKEVRRFSKVWMQTLFSPLVTTSLYFLVFGVALGRRLADMGGIPYIEFVIPGLVMLSMINNSFLNSASSLFQSKINGTLVDLLVAPLGPLEIMLAYVGASMVRAFLVGTLVWAVAGMFTHFQVAHLGWTLLFGAAVSASFSVLGLLVAIWADKFDHLAVVPNFVLTPLTFLGGVFYTVDMLPAPWDTVSRFNPILYMVNGLRYGLLDTTDVHVGLSATAVGLMLAVLVLLLWRMLRSGYKLRA